MKHTMGWGVYDIIFLELIDSSNLISFGRSFQIFGALERIVWAHFTVLDGGGKTEEAPLVPVLDGLVWLTKMSCRGFGILFSVNLCISLAISKWYIWLTLSNLVSFMRSRTLSRGFRYNIIRRNLFAHACIFFLRPMWPNNYTISNMRHNKAVIKLKQRISVKKTSIFTNHAKISVNFAVDF